jgi:hypothetical protein
MDAKPWRLRLSSGWGVVSDTNSDGFSDTDCNGYGDSNSNTNTNSHTGTKIYAHTEAATNAAAAPVRAELSEWDRDR